MEDDKTQALFLVDCASQEHTKATCLSCTRALLYLTNFPQQQTTNKKRLQWNFKLFSTRWQLPLRLHSKTTHFQDLSSDNLDVFFTELDKCNDSSGHAQPLCSTPPVQLLYKALAASVQDYPWDAPDIASPVLSWQHTGRRRKLSPKRGRQKKNFIFIVSPCPQSVEELSVFSGVGVTEDLGECVRGQLLPTPLLSQLEGRGITLHWIHHNTPLSDMVPPTLISELLAVTGGTLIPMATLIGHTDQVESKAAKKEKVTRSSLVASLFPSSLYLDKYLRSDHNPAKPTEGQNMYWLTTAGRIACACELSSMYHTRCTRGSHTTRTNDSNYQRDGDSISQTVPRIVIVGVVQQSDVPLPSLCPTSSCSCVSIHIPREIRTRFSLCDPATPLTMDPLDTATPLTMDPLDTATPLTMDPLDTATPITTDPLDTATPLTMDNPKTPENTCLLKRIFKTPDPHRPIDQQLLCLSPAIHLPRLPFTLPGRSHLPPERGLVSHLHLRQRCKSAPMIKTPLSQLLRRLVTVDVERCPLPRARRSVSMSPRDLKLQLTKIVKPPQVQAPHPRECVSERKRHSRQFQTLCLWLAKKGYLLIVRVCAEDGESCVSVIQPVSSLLATVTSVKPQYQDALISKVMKLEDLSRQQHPPPSDGDPRTVSDAELVASISLLSTSVGTVRPFTHQTLLPWLAYSELGGLDSATIDSLTRLHCEEDGRATTRLDLIAKLKAEYSCKTLTPREEKTRISEEESSGKVTEGTEESGDAFKGQEVGVASVGELRGWFQQCYHDQVEAELDQEDKGDALQRWASVVVPQYAGNFTALVANGDHHLSNQNDHVQAQLWAELNSSVLVSGVSLSAKYDNLFKSLHDHEEDNGNKDREKVIASQRLSEYLLQVLLRFEAMKACPSSCTDGQSYSDLLLFLLRKISLLSNPGLLGRLMRRTLLPLYVNSCRDVLLELYEGLMLPLPSDLNPDPESGVESVGGASQESSDEEGGSMVEPLQPATIINTRRLARHASFQDNQRQISVLSKKRRKSRKKNKIEKCLQKLSADTALTALRRSPRLMRTGTAENGRGGACRNLFTRSLSVCEASLKRPPTHEEDGERQPKRKRAAGLRRHSTMAAEVLVKETPVKKQVEHYQRFKLQRLRSKSTITSPDVVAIEESPRRSFYSKPKITRVHTADSAHFKTPPLKETAQLVCKEPSPASLHSLLHGEILAHQQTTPHSRARPSFPESPLKQAWLANQSSPIMFSSPVIDKDDCNVIGRTPSKGGQSVAKTTQETNSSWSTGRTARMLTYDNQLSKQMLELPSPKETTPPCILEEERTILDIPSLYTPHNNTQPDTWNVPEAMDPSIETESASMMAFALCTPTKEDRRDFHEAFLD